MENLLGKQAWFDVGDKMKIKFIIKESFKLDDQSFDRIYQIFKDSYEKETGQSWSKEKFFRRSRNWDFYGDDKGFIAVRKQYSGLTKLVGMAGDFFSILKGFAELKKEGGPIWGLVSGKIAKLVSKRGFISPSNSPEGINFIKFLFPLISRFIFDEEAVSLREDGGVEVTYPDVGKTTKYLIANKEYFIKLKELPNIKDALKRDQELNKSFNIFINMV